MSQRWGVTCALGVVLCLASASEATPREAISEDPFVVLGSTVRDFRCANEPEGLKDFDPFKDRVHDVGIVRSQLGADRKPVYDATRAHPSVESERSFSAWFSDVPGVNLSIAHYILLNRGTDGRYRFVAQNFAPIDGQLYGNSRGLTHNYCFTLELHAEFTHRSGALLDVVGADDLFVFVDGKLVSDLGGVHLPLSGAIDLSRPDLKLEPGRRYTLDLFYAQRANTGATLGLRSNFPLRSSQP